MSDEKYLYREPEQQTDLIKKKVIKHEHCLCASCFLDYKLCGMDIRYNPYCIHYACLCEYDNKDEIKLGYRCPYLYTGYDYEYHIEENKRYRDQLKTPYGKQLILDNLEDDYIKLTNMKNSMILLDRIIGKLDKFFDIDIIKIEKKPIKINAQILKLKTKLDQCSIYAGYLYNKSPEYQTHDNKLYIKQINIINNAASLYL